MSLHTGTYDSLPPLVRGAFDDRVEQLSRSKPYAVSCQRRYLGVYEQPGPGGPVPGQFQVYVVEHHDGRKKYVRLGRVHDSRLGAFLYTANAADRRLCNSAAVSSFLAKMRHEPEFAARWLNAIESQPAAFALLRLSIDDDATVKAGYTTVGLPDLQPHPPILRASQPRPSAPPSTAASQTPILKPLPPIPKPTPVAPVSSPEPPPPLSFGALFSRHFKLKVFRNRANGRVLYHPDARLQDMHARLLKQPGYPFRDSACLRKWIMTTFRHKLVLGNGASVEDGQIKASFCDGKWRFAGIAPNYSHMKWFINRCFVRDPDGRLDVDDIKATLVRTALTWRASLRAAAPASPMELESRSKEFSTRMTKTPESTTLISNIQILRVLHDAFEDEVEAGDISLRWVEGVEKVKDNFVIFGLSHRHSP
jgi:hypothetical protein